MSGYGFFIGRLGVERCDWTGVHFRDDCALTCLIIGLARKVTTLVASIYFYGHSLNKVQAVGLAIAVGAMVNDFFGKKGENGGGHGHGHGGGGHHNNGVDGESKQGGEEGVAFKDGGNLEEHQPMLASVSEEGRNNDNDSSASLLEMGRLLDKK